jgi:gamma-glutamylcyclotransferase (GGCT)/AIG2-like uncharacterized protein YtfP
MDYLFVYGKLKTTKGGVVSNYLKSNAELLGNAYMHAIMYDLGNYPGLIPSNDFENKVYGELFAIKDAKKVFAVLDDYEEAWPLVTDDPEYSRKIHDVYYNEIALPCWVYVYNWSVDGKELITSGIY